MKFSSFLITALTFGSAHAATVNLLPVADGQVADNGALGLSVNTTDTLVLTRSSGRDTRGIFEFDLSTIPDSATIISVDFVVTLGASISNTASSALLEFHSVTGDGSITIADFNSPGILQRTENFVLPVSNGTSIALPMSNLAPFQAVVGTNNEVGIRADTVNFVTFLVHSSEASVAPELIPNLVVTYVPEPSTGFFLLLSAALISRRSCR